MGYIALVIEEYGQKFIKEHFPALYPNVYGDHITLIFNPTEKEKDFLKDWEDEEGNVSCEFEVIGYVQDEFCQALIVEQDDGVFDVAEFPHITISTAEGIPPKYSKELLKKRGDNYIRVRHGLAGTIKYVY